MNFGKIFSYILKVTLIFVFSLFWGIIFLLWEWLKNDIIPRETPVIVVVYGNTVHEDGTLSQRLKARLDAALEVSLNSQTEKIIVSGAVGKEGHDEAKKMQEYLVKQGIPNEKIFIDSRGYTTQDSSQNSFVFAQNENLEWLPIVGISQYFHMARVKLSLQQALFSQVYGFAPKYFEKRDIYALLREIPAYVKYIFFYL